MSKTQKFSPEFDFLLWWDRISVTERLENVIFIFKLGPN